MHTLIYDWYTTELKLFGIKKELFAIIYQNSELAPYKESLSSLASRTGVAKRTIQRTLDWLVEHNLVERISEQANTVNAYNVPSNVRKKYY